MILLDVNILVYAFRESAPEHETYANWLREATAGTETLLLADLVLVGFVRVVTNPKVVEPVVSGPQAIEFVEALCGSPRTQLTLSSPAVWEQLGHLVRRDPQIKTNVVPDAYLAAVALTHGARVATRDRGFGRFPGLRWFDPAVAAG
jgi:uncharacterized protein